MLNNNQIQRLFDFTRQKRVRYKDVQIEIVDHLATAIEERQNGNPNLTFEKTLEQVYAEFGIFGFAKIVQQKEQAMQKFWQRRILHKIKKYYTLPRIIGTLGSSILMYQLLNGGYLEIKTILISLLVLSFAGIVWIMYKLNVLDNSIRDYLYIKSYYRYASGIFFLFFQIPNFFFPGLGDPIINPNTILNGFVSFFIPFSLILFYICMVEVPRELSREFHEKFGKYLELI